MKAKTKSNGFTKLIAQIVIVKKILALTDGRDKLMKVAQYSAKMLLWLYLVNDSPSKQRASAIASQFSLVRKVIRLAHVFEPVMEGIEILEENQYQSVSQKLAPLNVVVGIANDISDDIICLAKLGLLDKSWASKATPYSDRLWYISIFIDIHANIDSTMKLRQKYSTEKSSDQRRAIRQKLYVNQVSFYKLVADFVFCTIDVFQLDGKVSPGWQISTGLIAALLGSYKLYMKAQ